MALGLDPRFDLRQAYWLVAGIAGMDPADGSLGSAAWPNGWSTAIWGTRSTPAKSRRMEGRVHSAAQIPRRVSNESESYHLDPALEDWAYRLTKDVKLDDAEAMRTRREQFEQPNARRPPLVWKGESISSMSF